MEIRIYLFCFETTFNYYVYIWFSKVWHCGKRWRKRIKLQLIRTIEKCYKYLYDKYLNTLMKMVTFSTYDKLNSMKYFQYY